MFLIIDNLTFRSKYNEKADLWSMGTIIFLLMTGSYPFEGKNPVQVMQSITKGVYTFPSDIKISKTCLSIIHHLLQVSPERRCSFENYFSHPFVRTDPPIYLSELRAIFGPSYGLRDPLINSLENSPAPPPKHYEKSELLPPLPRKASEISIGISPVHIIMLIEEYALVDATDANDVPEVTEPASEDGNPFKSPALRPQVPGSPARLPISAVNSFFHRAAGQVLEQTDVVMGILCDPTRDCIAKSCDNMKLFLVMNLMRRVVALLQASARSRPAGGKEKRFLVVYSEKSRKKVAKLGTVENDPALPQLRVTLMEKYLRLAEHLRTMAFVLQELYKLQPVQGGVTYATRFALKGAKAEKSHNYAESRLLYTQALVVIDILLEECYVNETRQESVMQEDYCRLVEVEERQTRNPVVRTSTAKMMLLLRQLLAARIRKLSVTG